MKKMTTNMIEIIKGKVKAQMTDTHQNHIKHTPVIIISIVYTIVTRFWKISLNVTLKYMKLCNLL